MKTNVLANLVQPTPANNFRLLLQAELGRRCAGNPQYSLRAFAKYLGTDHATLSQLLRGKRPITKRMIVKLGTRLGLSKESLDAYCVHEHNGGPPSEQAIKLRKIQQMAQDTAALVSEWYHYAILELTRLQDFQTDSRWIARVLGITTDEVNIAMARLARLGLLEMSSRTRWIDKSGDTTVSLANFAQGSVQRLASTVRGLMLNALQGGTPFCLHSSTTLAMSSARLTAVQERIVRFQKELKSLVDQDGARDDVFQLEINVFSLTNLNQAKETSDGTTGNAVADRGD